MSAIDYLDDYTDHKDEPGGGMIDNATGNPVTHSDDPNASAPYNPNGASQTTTNNAPAFNGQAELDKIFNDGFKPGETDLANLNAKKPEDRAQFLKDLQAQEDKRAAPTASAGGSGGDAGIGGQPGVIKPGWTKNAGGQYVFTGIAGAPGAPVAPGTTQPGGRTTGPSFTGGGFSDPASSLLESYALDQFGRRINPDPNSGTAMFEKYARELIDTLKGPVYSAQDESIIKGQAFDAIAKDKDATMQRWLEELSHRNIDPSSGIALEGFQKIEDHFNGLRTQVDAQFAASAIDQTRAQRFQVLDTTARLSDAEEARLRDAGTYARVPYDLNQSAFQRNLQLVGAGGSPADLVGSSLAQGNFNLSSIGAGATYGLNAARLQQLQDAARSGDRAAQMQYYGYLLEQIFGGRG